MQKLDKPVELEGRVIRFKAIAKRNIQTGGALKEGDHVKTLDKNRIYYLKTNGKKNIFIVKKVFPEIGTILVQHIDGGKDIILSSEQVEEIDSSVASVASAASAASTAPPNFFKEFKQHINSNNNVNNWEVVGKPKSPVIVKRPNSSFVMIERSNSNSPVVFLEEHLLGNPDFECKVYGNSTKDGFLFECPECHATTLESNYNKTRVFPHKKGCSNIGKYCRFVVRA